MSGCAPPIFYLFIFYISFLYFLLVSLPLQFHYLSIFYFASISTTKLFPFLISHVYFLNWMTGKRSIEFVILILVNAHKIQKNKQNTKNNNKYAYRRFKVRLRVILSVCEPSLLDVSTFSVFCSKSKSFWADKISECCRSYHTE